MSAKTYELVVVIDPQLEEKSQKKLLEKIKSQLKEEGGESVKSSSLGLKQLAYPIDKKERGSYHIFNFSSSGFQSGNINIFLNREKEVLRYLLLSI